MRKKIPFILVKCFRLRILLIVFFGLAANSSFSQTNTWIGTIPDTFANIATSWSLGVVPTASSDIIIPDGAAPLFVGSNTTWASVTFLGGNQATRLTAGPTITLTITGNITIEDASAPRDIRIFEFFNCAAIVGGTNTSGSGNRITVFTDGDVTIPGDVSGCDLLGIGSLVARFGGNFTGGTVFAPIISGVIPIIDFNSSDPQIVPAGTYGLIAFTGGGDKTLAGPITVTSEASFNNGIVINSSPIFFDGSFGGFPSVTAGSDLSYATGPVRWLRQIVGSAFTFPVGKLGAGYHPVTVDPQSIVPSDFTVEYIRSSARALGPVTASGILDVSGCEYWNIDRTVGGLTVITLTWSSSSSCGGPYITDPSTIRAVHFNGTSWDQAGTSGGNGTATAGSVTWGGVAEFSPFTLGTISLVNSLPVTLTDLSANRCGNNICLYWNTASENNNDHFEIERSADGRQFNSIGSVNGNGTTSIRHSYTFSDVHPLNGKNYYRLKQVDIDRRFSYSSVLRVNNSSVNSFSASISPNPAASVMNLIIEGVKEKENLLFVVMNTSGMIVHRENISAGGTTMVKTLPRPAISAGLYFYKITRSSNNETFSGKLVLQ